MTTRTVPTSPTRALRALLALLAMLLALPTDGQPLIDQVPQEAALYVGWRGAADMGPDYAGSNMQGVIEETGLLEALPQLIEAIQNFGEAEGDAQAARLIGMGGTLWTSMWERGGAMYMLPPAPNGPPIPRLAVLWAGAKDHKPTRDALDQLVKLMNDAEQVPVFLSEAGGAMVLSVAFDASQLQVNPLSGAERFKQAKTQVQPDGALVVYVDAKEWIEQVDAFAEQAKRRAAEWGEQDPFAELWPTLREVSGLAGVNRLMLTAGIEGKDWHTQAYLDAPAPRKGFLALVDNAPITPANLAHVPKTATYLQAFSMEPGRVLDVTRRVLGVLDEKAGGVPMVAQLDRGLAEASKEVGVDLEQQLIKGMGPVWSAYIDPMIAGNGFSSLVLVNELKDADAVEKALFKLTEAANEALEDELDQAPIQVRFMTRQVGDATISHLGIPYVAPAWMVHKGRLYVSLFPQGLEMAAAHSGKAQDCITANPAFIQTLAQFGDKPYTGLSFVDLPETAPDGYGMNLIIVQTLAGAGEMFSGKPSAMRMPPIGKVMPFVKPSGSLTWVDGQGIHMHSIEPFPASALLGPGKGVESMMAVSGPMAVAVLLPALGSARAAAHQAQAMNQARQITVAMFAYQADHNAWPDDIAQLQPYAFGPELFIVDNAERPQPVPFNFAQWEAARQAGFVRKNSSYVLVPIADAGNLQRPDQTVALFQRPGDAPRGKINIGWADGHVTTEADLQRIEALLKAQTGMTMDQLIQRQEALGE